MWKVEYGRTYYAENRDLVLERNRQKYAENPDKDRDKHLRRKYGMTLEQFDEKLEAQGGRCPICETDKPGGAGNRFHVDHDHKTMQIRKLLCIKCNAVVGYADDDPDRLVRAAEYLKEFRTLPVNFN
jgi:hypothetical protein